MNADINLLSKRTGFGVRRLAKLLGVAPTTIQRWKRGEPPAATTQTRLNQFLAMSDDDLRTAVTLLTRKAGVS